MTYPAHIIDIVPKQAGTIAIWMMFLLLTNVILVAQINIEPRLIFETENKLPRISPDGRYFSFINRKSRSPALFDRQTGTSWDIDSYSIWGGRSLSTGQSIWAPDSKSVIFYWVDHDESSLRKFDITTGTHMTLLNVEGKPVQAWPVDHTKDGKYLLGIFGPEKTAYFGLIPVAGGHADTLDFTGHAFKSISPDGNYILHDYYSNENDWDIKIYSFKKRKSESLISTPGPDHIMTWVNDSSFVHATIGEETNTIWKINLNENQKITHRTKISDRMRGWYPVGKTENQKYCYFSREGWSEIYQRAFDMQSLSVEKDEFVVTINDNIRVQPKWTSNGHIMTHSGRYSALSNDFEIEEFNTVTDAKRTLNLKLDAHLNPDPGIIIGSDDGTKLISSVFNDSTRTRDCLVVRVSDKQVLSLIKNCHFPSFISENRVVYISGSQILEFDILTNQVDTIYRSNQRMSQLSLSNDKSRVAFYQGPYGQLGPKKLMILNRFENESEVVAQMDRNNQFTPSSKPNWFSGDTLLLISVSDEPLTMQQLMLVDLPSGNMRNLGRPIKVGENFMHHMDLHPSQQKLTYSIIKDITKVWEIDLN